MRLFSTVACVMLLSNAAIAADLTVTIPETDIQIWTLVQPTLERCIGSIAIGGDQSSCKGLNEFLRGTNDRIQAAAKARAPEQK